MISINFEYYRPQSAQEAAQLFRDLDLKGKNPAFFSGGTEQITHGRFNAVIDIQEVPECRMLQSERGYLALGSALTLTEITESRGFPLLSKAVREIADHTSRNKITLGGNICGQIFYREAVLPFLLTDSKVVTLGANGKHIYSIHDVFDKQLQLKKGEMLILLLTEERYLLQPFANIKVRQRWDTGYPLVTISALEIDGHMRVAFSGVCPFPFRSQEVEEVLNDAERPVEERIEEAVHRMPGPILHDSQGSIEYRQFVIKNTLFDILSILKR
ncbi:MULTISPECIES: FAD binding domain-containing protein [unclassified Bacillus (in: firmicutes)]|uniref:FAD binding domain-containing protein n=1 Tax=unclassified Bacillus (in: firmicutes) TaxID=185979 RepID=UPI0004152A7C|nr:MULTISPECIES: FAD binding domain-containing protein [unclassified Bacillus (in: firmicutes)]QHZ45697.1 xanthine dehydrogenase [Bacillus sp. NSP9.1]WFA04497.1 FAD binding domain-containing protein [Bacillus sp. HSf4]